MGNNSGSGEGVSASSTSGIAVYGVSSTGNGLVGVNSRTDQGAAAISAITGSTSALAYWGNGGIQLTGSFAQKAGGGSWSAPSDRRIKKDVALFGHGLDFLMKVHPVRFKYNGLGGTADDGREYVGVIAQDLEKIIPAMVTSHMAKLHPSDARETAVEEVDPSDFTYLLINAVQEQQRVIERQEARLSALEKGRGPVSSSTGSTIGRLETGAAIGCLPVGLLVAVGRRRKQA